MQAFFLDLFKLRKIKPEMMALNGARTDLAAEDLPRGGGELPGVCSRCRERDGFPVTEVEVLDEQGEKTLCKPKGKYLTMDMERFLRREEDAFARAAQLLADCVRSLLPLGGDDSVLVAGLGNPAITPDAVGPETAALVLATRHLRSRAGDAFSFLRPVSVCRTGVLGTTGMESAELIRAVAGAVRPSAIVVIDALAARSTERLCRTVQLTDSGIVPGSGVGNDRAELSARVLGVPVTAIGVPTVVDAGGGLIVTPRDIDRYVKDAGRLIACSLNLALHPGLTLADVDMLAG